MHWNEGCHIETSGLLNPNRQCVQEWRNRTHIHCANTNCSRIFFLCVKFLKLVVFTARQKRKMGARNLKERIGYHCLKLNRT